jgi:hypothetical protein
MAFFIFLLPTTGQEKTYTGIPVMSVSPCIFRLEVFQVLLCNGITSSPMLMSSGLNPGHARRDS